MKDANILRKQASIEKQVGRYSTNLISTYNMADLPSLRNVQVGTYRQLLKLALDPVGVWSFSNGFCCLAARFVLNNLHTYSFTILIKRNKYSKSSGNQRILLNHMVYRCYNNNMWQVVRQVGSCGSLSVMGSRQRCCICSNYLQIVYVFCNIGGHFHRTLSRSLICLYLCDPDTEQASTFIT